MSVDIKENEINLKDYIEDWLKEVEGDKQKNEEHVAISRIDRQKQTKTDTVTDTVNTSTVTDTEYISTATLDSDKENKKIGRLDKIGKRFQTLRFDNKWKTKLLSDNFILLGATGKGDEKYLTLEMALYNAGYKLREGGLKAKIRKYIQDLTQWEFLQFLDKYKIQKSDGKFTGKWDPFGVRNKNEFLREFKSPHFTLEDDNIMMSLISQMFNVDFIIFHENYCIQDLRGLVLQNKFIILYKFTENNLIEGQKTFICCVGLKKKKKRYNKLLDGYKIDYKFDNEHLPTEISILLNREEFIFKHVLNLIDNKLKNKNALHLDEIIGELEKILCMNFSHSEIRGIIKIINSILSDKKYFS